MKSFEIDKRHIVEAWEKVRANAESWRELGVALSKGGQLAEAENAFARAVHLDDGETWATLGGLQRRLARSAAGLAATRGRRST